MRLVHLLGLSQELGTVTGVLDDESVDYVVTEERTREGAEIVEFPGPVGTVESIVEALRDVGIADATYTVVANAETATERFAELEECHAAGTEEDDSVVLGEIRSKARSALPDRRSYYVMTTLSAIVATAGLLLDSPAVGIGFVWALPAVAVGAATLLVVDTASIVLAGTVTLWYLGYRPEGWTPGVFRPNVGREETVVLLVTSGVLLAVFAVPAVAMVEHVRVENSANGAVQDTIERGEYSELTLRSVSVEFTGPGSSSDEREASVVVSRPADETYPQFATDIGRRHERRTGEAVAVTVEFAEQTEFRSGNATG